MKITSLLLITFLSFLMVCTGYSYYDQSQEIHRLTTVLQNTTAEVSTNAATKQLKTENLTELNHQLDESRTTIDNLTSGNEFLLHDPTGAEATFFIEVNGYLSLNNLTARAKSQGIRCANLIVHLSTERELELIGFNTLDRGLIYYEAVSEYEVKPVVGKIYEECVVGHPYVYGNATISDLLVIW